MICLWAFTANAGGKSTIQNYFNTTAQDVKAAADPAEKRAILSGSFIAMSKALDMLQDSPLTTSGDAAGIRQIKASILDKQNELAGTNGYAGVTDAQLNAFSTYVVQDMEQADQIVSISLVSLLLILILIVLIL